MLDGGPQAVAAALHALGLIQLRLDALAAPGRYRGAGQVP